MKKIKYKKCKLLIKLIIIFFPYFFSYERLYLQPIYLNNNYTKIET